MKQNGLFSLYQCGFLRLHSTLTCLLKSTDDWYNGLDLGRLVGLLFIDLKTAFDTVDLDILCKKNFKFMVFSSESCLGLGHTYPTVNNSAGLIVLPQTYRM